jgi:hypothetical protein
MIYRVTVVVRFIGLDGRQFHPSERIHEQPWWSAFAAISLVLIGAGIVVRLLPERRLLIRRFARTFRQTLLRKGSLRVAASLAATIAITWLVLGPLVLLCRTSNTERHDACYPIRPCRNAGADSHDLRGVAARAPRATKRRPASPTWIAARAAAGRGCQAPRGRAAPRPPRSGQRSTASSGGQARLRREQLSAVRGRA